MTAGDRPTPMSGVTGNGAGQVAFSSQAVEDGQDSVDAKAELQHEGKSASLKGLRLLFAVDSLFPGLGGAEGQALKLAVALRERGAYVEFVAPRVQTGQPVEDTYQGFIVRRLDYPHIRWIGSLVLMVWFARYLLANRKRFDALHIHITHLLAASAGYMRRWTGLPVTTKISGFYEFEGGVLDQRRRFMPLNFLIRLGLRQVDHVQTISVQTREKLLAAGFRNEQIKFVPNGIDTSLAPQLPIEGETLTIGYCGRLREVKGVHVLLDAFALALQANPERKLHLRIAGGGEVMDTLQAQAEALGVASQVEWLGRIEDTASFFRSLDIYVQPSFAEGLPNSVMEAMVEQRPVIASDIGGNNDLIESGVTGLLFKVGDATQLSEQLQRLIDEPGLRHAVARSGRELIVGRFGFDRVVDELLELYHHENASTASASQ